MAAGLPAVPLSPQEQALLDLEEEKKKAVESEDYDEAKRLKDLEAENVRLKRAIAELTLDKQILKEAAEGNNTQPLDLRTKSTLP